MKFIIIQTSSSDKPNQVRAIDHPPGIINPASLHHDTDEPNSKSNNVNEDEGGLTSANHDPTELALTDHQSGSNHVFVSTAGGASARLLSKNLDLTQKVARLLSQEPPSINPTLTLNPTSSTLQNICNNQPSQANLNQQISVLIEQKVKIFDEKLKLYQLQITQLRSELATKDQLLEELHKIRQTDVESLLENHKSISEARFKANEKLIKTQSEELKQNRETIKALNAKLSRVYSGEEERSRLRLEEEKQELITLNEQLKAASDSQRRRRKEAEKEAQRAALIAQENVRQQLKEADEEVRTLKKMLETETENSKALISQLNQLRATSTHSHHSGNYYQKSNHTNNTESSSGNNSSSEKTIQDLKSRVSIIGDFTGFTILNCTVDKKGKGNIFDCIVTDIVGRSLALNFKLQFHSDNTLSYFPSLDPERDSETEKILPEFLRSFVRFQKEASGHVFWKIFKAFNL